jgi:SWI/SNF-related matrix-associated actin-dependent regulator 1 of chromatin subfamily A
MITASINNNKIQLDFTFNPYIINAIKGIDGHRYNPTNKTWTLPKDKHKEVEELQAKFGGLPDKEVFTKPQEINDIPPLPELTMDIPLKRALYHYQGKGTAQGLIYKRFINGDEPGLGKTAQSIATAVGAGCKCILVICPASLKINWQREWMIVAGRKSMILNDSVKTTWHKYYAAGMNNIFIVNYESLKKYFVAKINTPPGKNLQLKYIEFKKEIELFDCIIIDELHRCKDGSTQQAKFVMGLTRGKEYVIGLTGTPVVNKPKDLISQLYIINQLSSVVPNYKYFMDRYCGGNGQGAFNLQELNYKLSTTCFFRRQKKDVLDDLPDKMRNIISCDITTRKEYDAALHDLAVYLKQYREKTDAQVQRSMNGEVMVKIGVCKNIAARGKLNEVFEYIDEVTDSGEKVVVFIHQKEIALAILGRYSQAVSVRGADSQDERQVNIDKFQTDPRTNVIVCSIKAAGVGITLTASSRVAFVELPWHPADCEQCEDRCHRIGQKNSVQVTYFLGSETIDEDIYDIIEKKRVVANEVTGTEDNVQREIINKIKNLLL